MTLFDCQACSDYGEHRPPKGSPDYLRYVAHFMKVDGFCPAEFARRMATMYEEWKNVDGKAKALAALVRLRRNWRIGVREGTHPDAHRKMQILAELHNIKSHED